MNIQELKLKTSEQLITQAEELGIENASNLLLAFLDTSTHPCNDWLSDSMDTIDSNNYQIVWGKTYYQAEKFLPKIFRACTYGEKPIKTLPGSILHKNVFKKCGLFVESTRAGEDGDFMSRVELHNINVTESKNFLNYEKLNKMSFFEILKKWYRNYFHTAQMPYSRAHKNIYFYVISLVAVIVAYNWNRILDPTGIGETREMKLVSYRQTRDQIVNKLKEKWGQFELT